MRRMTTPSVPGVNGVASVVLFDGVCNLCNASVNFLVKRDRYHKLYFATLQSSTGKALLSRGGLSATDLSTMVLVEGERAWTKSAAWLRIMRKLPAPWPGAAVLVVVPAPLRDAVYDVIARKRYRWWGRQESCPLPTGELKERLLS